MNDIIKSSHEKLEIKEIINNLKSFAILPKTKEDIDNLKPSKDIEFLKEELKIVDEALKIILRFERAPIMMSSDFDTILDLACKNATLSGEEIYEVYLLFQTIKANQKLLKSLTSEKIECPYYEKMVNSTDIIDYLDEMIIKSVDETGYVIDTASSTLQKIRHKLSLIDQNIKTKCQEIISKESSKLASNSYVIRNDCYCLAVKIEYKNMVKGTIQDYSSSMQTVFIEPFAIRELVREKSMLYHEEHTEVERILKELSKYISIESERLRTYFKEIKRIDFVFAKAVLADKYNGKMPSINSTGDLILKNARHPLLRVKKVIPNNISFTSKYDGIIITGPNTGGKTVLLKTIGLLVLMTKYGLLTPLDEGSNVMIYDDVYCDIGDDQSIQNNLSTFSSHMNNIVQIIDNITSNSLVLFDEIGAGTDPIEGSNLAKAILKYLIRNHVSFITTTHYSDLKAFAFEEPRIINASMEFDQNTLSPTYHLLIGVSGSSNCLNIASKLGLKEEIIDEASSLMLENDSDTRKLILKLEQMVNESEIERKKLDELITKNKQLETELNKKLEKIEKTKNEIIEKATLDAMEIIKKAKNEGKDVIASLQEKLNQNLKLHEVIALKKKVDDLEVTPVKPKKQKPKKVVENINIGDDVYIESYDQYGEVLSINKNGTYHVSIGNIKLDLKKEELTKAVKEEYTASNKVNMLGTTSKANVKVVLDLRGKRYEDALDALDKYIDDLVLVGIKQASIIHGYGTGAIRQAVQSFIKKCPYIKSSRYGGEKEGGFGVTVIELK